MEDDCNKGLDTSVNEKVLELGQKKARKVVFRKTIDFNASVINYLKNRIYLYDWKDRLALQPDYIYNFNLMLPHCYKDCPMTCVTSKAVRTSTNKNKCPIYCVCWTPEGRRLLTGAFSGEITLWNGLTFNFETIQQAHETQIRVMRWSHNDEWLLTADHSGFVKYWQANMNNVEVYQAHKEPIRGASFSPFDTKFVTCSDDSTVRVWDFNKSTQERVLRGHGADVRCVAWHPSMSLIISGSKDAQQPIKLWDPKTGESITTLYVHKSTCTDLGWNNNGNWFLTASRDHLIKLFDIRNLKCELQTFRGHKKDVMRIAWHPIHETVFCSGSGDGAIYFWNVGSDTELSAIENAHENMIWSLAWHPLGHILVSGANDFQTKFWTRDRPGDISKEASLSNMCGVVGFLNPINFSSAMNNPVAEPVPLEPTFDDQPKEVDQEEAFIGQDRVINIPGIAEEEVENLNVLSSANIDDKKRYGKAIPRTFAANWAANPPPNTQPPPNPHGPYPNSDPNYPGMMMSPMGGRPPMPGMKMPPMGGPPMRPLPHPMGRMPLPNQPRFSHPMGDPSIHDKTGPRDLDERNPYANGSGHRPHPDDDGLYPGRQRGPHPPYPGLDYERMGRPMPPHHMPYYRGGPPPSNQHWMGPPPSKMHNNGRDNPRDSYHPPPMNRSASPTPPDCGPPANGESNLPPRREWADRGMPPPQSTHNRKRRDW